MTFNKLLTAAILFTLTLALFSSCYYDNYEELNPAFGTSTCDTTGTISFTSRVQPILVSYCGTTGSSGTACHGTGSSSGWPLVSYADIKNSADVNLMNAVRHTGGVSPMPKGGGSLDDCSIAVLQKWIDQGTQNN